MTPTYWETYLDYLRMCLDGEEPDNEESFSTRITIYNRVRKKTGLKFAGFGDDMARWIQWLDADDTRSYDETMERLSDDYERLSDEEKERLAPRYRL